MTVKYFPLFFKAQYGFKPIHSCLLSAGYTLTIAVATFGEKNLIRISVFPVAHSVSEAYFVYHGLLLCNPYACALVIQKASSFLGRTEASFLFTSIGVGCAGFADVN